MARTRKAELVRKAALAELIKAENAVPRGINDNWRQKPHRVDAIRKRTALMNKIAAEQRYLDKLIVDAMGCYSVPGKES